MKKRFLLLPLLIISVMILILKYENRYPVSKELFGDSYYVVYPYFHNRIIDNKVHNFLNNIMANECDYLYIYYDLLKDNNNYYISFYIYKEFGNILERKVYVLENIQT